MFVPPSRSSKIDGAEPPGVTTEEAQARLAQEGPNVLPSEKEPGFFMALLPTLRLTANYSEASFRDPVL
ncbi:MAG: hypothetical protein KC416_04485 [Myxococcales bacterium]|nr:hypothetical protein [Myxococcales bacterium]